MSNTGEYLALKRQAEAIAKQLAKPDGLDPTLLRDLEENLFLLEKDIAELWFLMKKENEDE